MPNFNARILKEIAHLRHLRNIGAGSDRITHCLEILRLVRNTELGLLYEEGLKQEDLYIKHIYSEDYYFNRKLS